jgi:hypothetical protein
MAAERRICTKQKIAKIKMNRYRRKCEDKSDMAGAGGRACTKKIDWRGNVNNKI